jgi:HSP20 family protein
MTVNALSSLNLPLFYDRLEDFFPPSPATGNVFASIIETNNRYELYLPLPGVDKENIKMNISGNILSITVGYLNETADVAMPYTCPDCSKNYFNHSFDLDEQIDKDKIEMQYEDHILKLTMPFKKELVNSL